MPPLLTPSKLPAGGNRAFNRLAEMKIRLSQLAQNVEISSDDATSAAGKHLPAHAAAATHKAPE